MVAYTFCAACTTGDHEKHVYWIQKPPKGVMGGFACRCSGPEECAGNGEKLLRSLFGEDPPDRLADRPAGHDAHQQTAAKDLTEAVLGQLPAPWVVEIARKALDAAEQRGRDEGRLA